MYGSRAGHFFVGPAIVSPNDEQFKRSLCTNYSNPGRCLITQFAVSRRGFFAHQDVISGECLPRDQLDTGNRQAISGSTPHNSNQRHCGSIFIHTQWKSPCLEDVLVTAPTHQSPSANHGQLASIGPNWCRADAARLHRGIVNRFSKTLPCRDFEVHRTQVQFP